METLHQKNIIEQGRQSLRGMDSGKMAALYAGVSVGVGLLVTLVQYLLSMGIGNTGGLSGLGTRAILETAQTVLQWANTLLLPFWELGFVYVALCWARGKYARPVDMLTGFRRFGSYLLLMLNKGMILVLLMMLTANLASVLYMLTPASKVIMELAVQVNMDMNVLQDMMVQMSTEQLSEIFRAMAPMIVIWGIMALSLMVPILYRLRMAEYLILDNPTIGALRAMIFSFRMTKRRCVWLLKLDLRFWWYYGLQVLSLCLCYGDLLLQFAGVQLPVDSMVLFFICYGAHLVSLFALRSLWSPWVECTYAHAYEAFRQAEPEAPPAPAAPTKLPWDEQ